jgi:hypothetical protein
VHPAGRAIDGRFHGTVRLTLWPAPVDAIGRRAGDLSSDGKQFNSNVNGLAPRSRPPFWLQFPAAATLSASANQTIGWVDQFNRRSYRL